MRINFNVKKSIFYLVLFLIVFLAGFQNSEVYLSYMGLHGFISVSRTTFYFLLFGTCYYFIIKFMLLKKRFKTNSFPYWLVIVIAVSLKFFLLFIQSPHSLLPGGSNYDSLLVFGLNFMLMMLLISVINSMKTVRITIWALGLSSALSAVIPIIFFPDMIGSRSTIVQGFNFIGGFWNPSVISFISIGWILIALSSIEKSRFKRSILIIIFLTLLFGGIVGLSRATLVAIIISVIFYLILSKKIRKYFKTFIALAVGMLLLVSFFPDLITNFNNRLDNGIDIQNEPRTTIWLDYIEDVPSYFLLGELEGDYRKYSATRQGPHSVPLNWLVQYGILGLVGFLLIILGLIRSVRLLGNKYTSSTTSALYAWITAYLSVALINETGFSQITVFAAFGIIYGWGKVISKSTKDTQIV